MRTKAGGQVVRLLVRLPPAVPPHRVHRHQVHRHQVHRHQVHRHPPAAVQAVRVQTPRKLVVRSVVVNADRRVDQTKTVGAMLIVPAMEIIATPTAAVIQFDIRTAKSR